MRESLAELTELSIKEHMVTSMCHNFSGYINVTTCTFAHGNYTLENSDERRERTVVVQFDYTKEIFVTNVY